MKVWAGLHNNWKQSVGLCKCNISSWGNIDKMYLDYIDNTLCFWLALRKVLKYQNYDCTSFVCLFFTWFLAFSLLRMGQNISLPDLPHWYPKCFSQSPFSFLLETDVLNMSVLRSKSLWKIWILYSLFYFLLQDMICFKFWKDVIWMLLETLSSSFFIAVFGPWFKRVDFICKFIYWCISNICDITQMF